MPPKPKTEADLRAFKYRTGFEGVLTQGGTSIRRKCAACGQPTKGIAEAHCGKHGGKRQAHKECQVDGCTSLAKYANGTRCQLCWVAEDPAARGCPACRKQLKRMTRPDGLCSNCVRDAAVEARREARHGELAQLCADEGIEAGAPDGAAGAAFRTRYAVPNVMDDYRPVVRVRAGKEWQSACAVRGCPSAAVRRPGTPGTHCRTHGGGHRCPGRPGEDRCSFDNAIEPCERDDRVRYVHDGVQYCCSCFCAAFKDHELTKNAKRRMHAKEQAVREFLERRFAASHPQLKWVMDRQVEGTRRRPDHRALLHLLGVRSHDLVLETDENSHWFYLCAEERTKEADVHRWLNAKTKPLFFVRFNPDAYDDPATGERVPSCWGIGKDGIDRVKPSKRAEWDARLEKLAQVVEEYLVDHTDAWAALAKADRPKPELHAVELFYDDVALKKNAAAQAFDAIRAAAKGKKRARQ